MSIYVVHPLPLIYRCVVMDIENYYKIILLGDRCTQVEVVCPRPLCSGVQLGLEPTTCELQV